MAKKKTSAFDKPMQLSGELEAVVGKGPMARTKVTKNVWAYIKKHDLQNPDNRREIVPDAKLAAVFGSKRKIDMFKMTKKISEHLS